MYAKYVYNAGATIANILADVVLILTGTTNTASLSASCNVAASSITATTLAGWTVYDADAGTNQQVLISPNADSGAKYLAVNTNTAGYILFKVYHAWNAGANTGTNLAYNSDVTNYAQRIDASGGGTLYLSASNRHALCASNIGAGWGSVTSTGPSGIVERTRYLSFDTTSFGYPPSAFINFGAAGIAYAPKLYTYSLTDVLTSSAALSIVSTGISSKSSLPSGSTQRIPNTTGGSLVPFFPVILQGLATMPAPYGEISSLSDIWMVPRTMFTNLDETTKNGVTYVAWRSGADTEHIVVPKR